MGNKKKLSAAEQKKQDQRKAKKKLPFLAGRHPLIDKIRGK